MSYLVLARKWRPLAFEDVVGQEHVTSTLKKAIEKNRVAHAYVFTGTRGVGKTTTARILARAMNCENGPTPEPCGECESCKNIINGSSFDVLEIDGASNNSVEDIRELRDNINYSSMGGKHRIYVIDEVHMLSKSAFNALLKTLEEPPKNVIFIFATTEPQKIPETIHSRCQRYDFRRISTERIAQHLEQICTNESVTFDHDAIMLIARKADGSMRDSLSLLDQVYSFCRDNITEKEVRSVLGLVDLEVYTTIMDAIVEKKPEHLLGAVEETLVRGFDLHEFITGFQEHLRNLLFARLPGVLQSRHAELHASVTDELQKQSLRFSEGDLIRMTETVRKAEQELKWSSYPRFSVEVMLLKLLYMDSTVSIEQILSAIKGESPPPDNRPSNATSNSTQTGKTGTDLKKKNELTSSPLQTTSPTPGPDLDRKPAAHNARHSQGPAVTSIPQARESADSFQDSPAAEVTVDSNTLWPGFLEILMKERPNLATFLSVAYVASITDNSIDIRFASRYGFQYAEITRKRNRDTIQNMLAEFAGKNYDLHITREREQKPAVKETDIPKPPPGTSFTPSLRDDIENEPIIKTILDVFDGEILS